MYVWYHSRFPSSHDLSAFNEGSAAVERGLPTFPRKIFEQDSRNSSLVLPVNETFASIVDCNERARNSMNTYKIDNRRLAQ